MNFTHWFDKLKSVRMQQDKDDKTLAIGSEAMHDAGLTDDEATGLAPDSASKRKRHYIQHNDLPPEDKISIKKKLKTPI